MAEREVMPRPRQQPIGALEVEGSPEMAAEIERLREEAEAVRQELAVVSHALSNQLMVLSAHLDLLEELGTDRVPDATLGYIRDAATRSVELLPRLRALYRRQDS